MAMASNLKELRRAAGYDLNQVAEILGVCWETAKGWENGRSMQYRFRAQVAELYHVSHTELNLLLSGVPIAIPGSDRVDVTRCKDCQNYLLESQFCRNVFLHKKPMGYCDSAVPREVSGDG